MGVDLFGAHTLFFTDRKKMGDSRGESLTSTVVCVTFISW